MDFVVVGLGVGALAILLGLTIREVGARWWSIQPDVPLSSPDQARRLAIGRVSRAGGSVLSLAGGLILLATIAAIALGLPDRTGAIVVMVVVTIAVLGTVAWGAVYARRSHPRSANRSRRPRPTVESLPDQRPSLAGTIDAAFASDGEPPAAGRQAGDRQAGDMPDTPLAGPFAPANAHGSANAAGSTAAPGSGDAPGAEGAPDALAEAQPEATRDETPASDGADDSAPERPAPATTSTGPGQPAASAGSADRLPLATALIPNPGYMRAQTALPGDGQPAPSVPESAPVTSAPTDDAQDSKRTLADAPDGSGAGSERPAPSDGVSGQPLADAAPTRPPHADPARKDRPR